MSNEEDSEMVFRAKMHFFASEVWTLEDQAEKLQLQVLVLPEKDNSFWNLTKVTITIVNIMRLLSPRSTSQMKYIKKCE